MNVLFVTEDCPYPPDNGGRLRTFSLLRRLSVGHDITLIAPGLPGADINSAFDGRLKQVILVPPVRHNMVQMLGMVVSHLPYAVHKCWSPAMTAAVRDALSRNHFDLLHCDSTLIAPSIPVDAPLPRVLNAHNVEAVIWRRYLAYEHRPWMIPILRSQLRKTVAFESQLPELFDVCTVVSEMDRQDMRQCYRFGNAHVVPNGVDLSFYTPLPDPRVPALVLVGSLDYRPNKDAIRWFVGSIWPRIRAEIPEVQMGVVGRRPPDWLPGLCARAGISLHADVPDTRPYLARAALVVVPIRIGGGTRLKILEAMAAGKCVVSTTTGAEGLEVRDGEHLLIADDPADFALGVVSLLRAPLRRQVLADAGRMLVETRYSWDQSALRLQEAWELTVAEAPYRRRQPS